MDIYHIFAMYLPYIYHPLIAIFFGGVGRRTQKKGRRVSEIPVDPTAIIRRSQNDVEAWLVG